MQKKCTTYQLEDADGLRYVALFSHIHHFSLSPVNECGKNSQQQYCTGPHLIILYARVRIISGNFTPWTHA